MSWWRYAVAAAAMAVGMSAAAEPTPTPAAPNELPGLNAVAGVTSRPSVLLPTGGLRLYLRDLRRAAMVGLDEDYGACNARSFKSVDFKPYEETVDASDPFISNITENGDQAWRERLEVTGCGRTIIQNVLAVYEKKTKKVSMIQMLPGLTRVSPPVYRRFEPMLVAAAFAAKQDCSESGRNDWRVLDTKFSGAAPEGWDAGWTESWTVRFCGVRVELRPQFAPLVNGPGYGIRVDPGRLAARPRATRSLPQP